MRSWIRLAWLAVAGLAAQPVLAADVALLIGNASYRTMPDYRSGTEILGGRPEMSRAGIAVTNGANVNGEQMKALVAEFLQAAPSADGAIVALSGRFAKTSQETYFLPTDASSLSLAEVAATGLPLSTVLAALADLPGRAILVLSTDQQTRDIAPYLTLGLGPVDIPQGVTVVTGEPNAIEFLLEDVIPRPGRDMMQTITRSDRLQVSGFAPDAFVFLSPDAGPSRNEEAELDAELWATVQELNTIEGYESYLERFPSGRFAASARAGIDAIRNDPAALAERLEAELNLTREDRRAIQSNLTLLDYNTRGVDGIFGRGTRGAIQSFQRDRGFAATGYLTRPQIRELASLADERSRALEEEAARRAAEEAERDRAFWAQTGARGDEAGYRAYLEEFPDGRYAELANARLRVIEREKRENASAVERLFWEQAEEANSIDGYQRYLSQFPNGGFAEEARTRIVALQDAPREDPAITRARQEEDSLNLSASTKRTIEGRLNALGLKPGRVDGEFTEETRRAIRRYQSARRLNETGYLNEATVVRLFADTVISIFD